MIFLICTYPFLPCSPYPHTVGTIGLLECWFVTLGKPQYLRPLVSTFRQNLDQALDQYSADTWTSVSIRESCQCEVAGAAVGALFGPDLIALTPDFLDRFWAFDKHLFTLILGLPKWVNSKPYQAHDHYLVALEKWLSNASADFDWKGVAAEADWEPRFGGRAVRELYIWMEETDWRQETIAATLGALAFAYASSTRENSWAVCSAANCNLD